MADTVLMLRAVYYIVHGYERCTYLRYKVGVHALYRPPLTLTIPNLPGTVGGTAGWRARRSKLGLHRDTDQAFKFNNLDYYRTMPNDHVHRRQRTETLFSTTDAARARKGKGYHCQ